MTGLDADRLIALLERLVAACERIVGQAGPGEPTSRRRGRKRRQAGEAATNLAADAEAASSPGDLHLPPEIGTARAAEILGVS